MANIHATRASGGTRFLDATGGSGRGGTHDGEQPGCLNSKFLSIQLQENLAETDMTGNAFDEKTRGGNVGTGHQTLQGALKDVTSGVKAVYEELVF